MDCIQTTVFSLFLVITVIAAVSIVIFCYITTICVILFDFCYDKKNTFSYLSDAIELNLSKAHVTRDSIVAATCGFHARRVGSIKIMIT